MDPRDLKRGRRRLQQLRARLHVGSRWCVNLPVSLVFLVWEILMEARSIARCMSVCKLWAKTLAQGPGAERLWRKLSLCGGGGAAVNGLHAHWSLESLRGSSTWRERFATRWQANRNWHVRRRQTAHRAALAYDKSDLLCWDPLRGTDRILCCPLFAPFAYTANVESDWVPRKITTSSSRLVHTIALSGRIGLFADHIDVRLLSLDDDVSFRVSAILSSSAHVRYLTPTADYRSVLGRAYGVHAGLSEWDLATTQCTWHIPDLGGPLSTNDSMVATTWQEGTILPVFVRLYDRRSRAILHTSPLPCQLTSQTQIDDDYLLCSAAEGHSQFFDLRRLDVPLFEFSSNASCFNGTVGLVVTQQGHLRNDLCFIDIRRPDHLTRRSTLGPHSYLRFVDPNRLLSTVYPPRTRRSFSLIRFMS